MPVGADLRVCPFAYIYEGRHTGLHLQGRHIGLPHNPIMNIRQTILISLLVLCSCQAMAQSGKLPPFRMVQTNGKIFKAEDLPMGKPIIIIYFSTDCDHCSNLMKAMLAKTDELKKASVAMITYLPIENVWAFANQYQLKRFPYIYMGTEGSTYFLKNYYNLSSMPFMALYTKNGDLVKTYPNETGLSDLISRLKTLP